MPALDFQIFRNSATSFHGFLGLLRSRSISLVLAVGVSMVRTTEIARAAIIDIALVISRPSCGQTKRSAEKCTIQEVSDVIGGPAWTRTRNQTVMSDLV